MPDAGAGVLGARLGRWAAGPLGRWAAGPLGRWAAGPLGPLGRWAAGPLGRWAAGPLGRWAAGPLGRWAAGPLGRWAAGPLGRWAAGPLGRWAAGPLGRWAAGPLGRWAAGPLGRWAAGPLGRWAAGPLGRWAAGPLGRWAARRPLAPAEQGIAAPALKTLVWRLRSPCVLFCSLFRWMNMRWSRRRIPAFLSRKRSERGKDAASPRRGKAAQHARESAFDGLKNRQDRLKTSRSWQPLCIALFQHFPRACIQTQGGVNSLRQGSIPPQGSGAETTSIRNPAGASVAAQIRQSPTSPRARQATRVPRRKTSVSRAQSVRKPPESPAPVSFR